MGKNLEAKCKQCRRLGEKLMLKGDRCNTAKCAIVKRNFPPGMHGPKGRKRQSEFGLQLNEKQKAKKYYHLMEKQFRLTFTKAEKASGDTGKNFLRLLEMRLDNVVFRLGLASSHGQARALVNQGHFTVNDHKVNVPSYNTEIGDVIKIKKSSLKNRYFSNLAERLKTNATGNAPVSWLHFDAKELTGKILHEPSQDDLPRNINVQMIIEFYSK
jgi:small subunit ribosomal protein S4